MSVTHVTGTGDYSKPVPVQVAIFKNPRQSSSSVHALCPFACSIRGDRSAPFKIACPGSSSEDIAATRVRLISDCDFFAEIPAFSAVLLTSTASLQIQQEWEISPRTASILHQ